jgi:SRSO17 transposase
VGVTLSVANHHASLPIAYRLYLPKVWADDAERRNKAHVPEAIGFKTKPQSRCRPPKPTKDDPTSGR